MLSIPIANDADAPIDESRLRSAVESILHDHKITTGSVSIAIVDDPTIHDLNRRFLNHDYPTDVISFVLEQGDGHLEGEVVASADTAAHTAQRVGWSIDDELLLYIIHGALHLVGYDDLDPQSLPLMRQQERQYLAQFGLERKATAEEE